MFNRRFPAINSRRLEEEVYPFVMWGISHQELCLPMQVNDAIAHPSHVPSVGVHSSRRVS